MSQEKVRLQKGMLLTSEEVAHMAFESDLKYHNGYFLSLKPRVNATDFLLDLKWLQLAKGEPSREFLEEVTEKYVTLVNSHNHTPLTETQVEQTELIHFSV